ncbi:exopolysaccharide biosynthesis polyprenyl glycosylphosphotransferase [Mycobacterium sp. PO1]|uniref:Sugar transferase n=1 Tax=Mycolicibacterium parafortuitum TaxID=39692 RepID=A0ACC6MJG6_MYCPF|nr:MULTISPECIES: sugar transferase [Mycobacteriaceae]MDZ5087101.1 sugar transferase [Mycolicibacterium parafortuitum]GFM19187.1 exopolysaccharide biosynthesis polyprenyl glycosylphosphotransferase [Mycobacterium sp. PO1]GFM24629.1 exopolysaccharide biosynthesis polyprenyl glycosylphosphotransferase [Mycobacterium sp. PO2]
MPAHVEPDESPAPRWLEFLRNERGYTALTVVLDVWSAICAVALGLWWTSGPVGERGIAALAWLFVPIVLVILATRSMYRQKLNHRFLDDVEPVETSVAVAALGTLTVMMLAVPQLPQGGITPEYVRPSEVVLRIWVCAAVLLPLTRLIRSLLQRYLRRKYHFGVSALVVGSGPIAHQLVNRMKQVPDYGLRPVGLLDDLRPTDIDLVDVPYLGTSENLENAVRRTQACELLVAPSATSDEDLARLAHQAHRLGMRVRVVPRLMDAVGGGAWVEHLGGVPLIVLDRIDPKGWQFAVKHTGDRVAAGLGLLLISPIFLTLMLLVRLSSPGPIFFAQPRIGRDGNVFDCLKFRSMRPLDPNAAAFELKDGSAPGGVEGEDRRTWIGKIMRRTSLDELPQLINVVRGDMSLVGPRPERPEFVELFEMQIRRYGERHRVKAGVTGWAQVHGLRGQTSIADRAEFDNYYIENWSLLLDVKILLLTVLAVLRSAE